MARLLRAKDWATAACVLVSWTAYLRPSEALRLGQCDFLPPVPGGTGSWTIWSAADNTPVTKKTGENYSGLLLGSKLLDWAAPVQKELRSTGSKSVEQYTKQARLATEWARLDPKTQKAAEDSSSQLAGLFLDAVRGRSLR